MLKQLISVKVTTSIGASKRHIDQIGAWTAADALEHLKHRCEPGGEYARKFPGCTFSELEALTPHDL